MEMLVLIIGVLTLICDVGSDDSSDFQKQLPAQVIWAVIGKDAELPCDLTPDPGDRVNMVLWFKDLSGIPLYSVDNRAGDLIHANHSYISKDIGSRTFFQTVGVHPARLRVNNVGLNDEGMFRCRIDFLNSPTRNYRVNLTIVAPPSEPIIYDHRGKEVTGVAGPFLEGYELYLACHVKGVRPLPEVTWWLDGKILDHIVESSMDSVTVNQLFISSVPRGFHGRHLECLARSSDLTNPVVRTVPIDIYLKPLSVLITTDNSLLSAGKLHIIKCATSGSVPPARITWVLDGEPIRNAATTLVEGHNSTTSTLTFRPTASDDIKELACRAENPHFPGGLQEDRRRLRIAYPPVVSVRVEERSQLGPLKEGDEVRMSCEVRANPPADGITWYHGDHILDYDESEGIYPTGRSLQLRKLIKESAGEYSCAASNSEGKIRSGPAVIFVQYSPRCRPGFESHRLGAWRQRSLSVECEVDANPGGSDVRFSWTYNRSRDVLPVPGDRVNSSGTSSRLVYTPGSEQDFGTLACWASNSVGRQRVPCVFHVVHAKLPESPKDCVLRNRSESDGLEVACIPGFDGDLPQHFLLEVSESPSVTEFQPQITHGVTSTMNDEGTRPRITGPPIYIELGAKPVFMLHSLEAGKDYELAVFARNDWGKSDPPVIIPKVRVTTAMEKLTGEVSEEAESGASTQPMAVVLGVIVAAAFLILGGIFVTAGLVICKRRSLASQGAMAPSSRSQQFPLDELLRESPPKTSLEAGCVGGMYHDEIMNVMVHVPAHVSRVPRADVVMPRMRLRNEASEKESQPVTRTSIVEDEGGGGNSVTFNHRRAHNEPDLIVSRADMVLQIPISQPSL